MGSGFIFGDDIYEVVPVYDKRLFRFDRHMARLICGLEEVRIANPMTPTQGVGMAALASTASTLNDHYCQCLNWER